MSPLVHTIILAVCHGANQLVMNAIHGVILVAITQLPDKMPGLGNAFSASSRIWLGSCSMLDS